MNTGFKDGSVISGVVERRLFDGAKFKVVQSAMRQGLSDEAIDVLVDWASKPQFKANAVWRLVKNLTGKDIQSALTGSWTNGVIAHNTVTTVGKKMTADQLGGTTTTPVTAVAIGIGTPSATALGSEIATNGGARGAGTVTNTTTTLTGDTEQWVKSWTFSGSFAIIEEGLFNNNTSGGIMLASQSFSAVNVISGDIFQVTHKVKIA